MTTDEKNALLMDNIEHIYTCAKMISRRCCGMIEVEELVNIGVVAFLKVCENYDPSRAKISTWLYKRVHGAMLDWLRNENDLMKRTRRNLVNRFKRDPVFAESLTQEQQREIRFIMNADCPTSLSLRRQHENREELIIQPVAPTSVSQLDLRDEVRFALQSTSKKQRLCLLLYYCENIPYATIGKLLGISESRVCQVINETIFQIRKNNEKKEQRKSA